MGWWGQGRIGRVGLWKLRVGKGGQGFFVMLGQRWVTPGWADDIVQNQDGRRGIWIQDIGRQEERVGSVQ